MYKKGFLYFICAVSAMGGLLFGYDWVVIGGAKPFYELYFGIADSPLLQGVAMTTALVGCLAGAMVAGAAADKYGRKPLLMVSAVLVLFTILALYTIEKWGRRTLVLLGAGGLGLIYLILGTCYFMGMTGFAMVTLVVAAISVYAMTLGPVTWTLLAEIFPNRIRGIAMATCTFALWVGCCTLTFSFPSMNAALGSSGTFWVYSAICVTAFVYLFRCCPETKGKSLEELEKELVG